MTTINSVGVNLSGQTGTGNFVGSTSPTLITPVLGAASATSVTFSSTSGLIGSTTNDSAASGSVGQLISSVKASGSAVNIATNTATDLTLISLTAGDWDVWGNLSFQPAVTITQMFGWISATSATLPDSSLYAGFNGGLLLTNGAIIAPQLRFSLSTTTTIYISAFVTLSSSTCTMTGGIYARRRR